MSKRKKKIVELLEEELWSRWDILSAQVKKLDDALGDENSPDSLLTEWVDKATDAHNIVLKLRALRELKKSKN